MKHRYSKLMAAALFVLLLVGNFWSISQACVFVAWVRDPNDEFNGTRCREFLDRLPPLGQGIAARDGWSLTWYGGTPVVLNSERRHFHTLCSNAPGHFDTLYYGTQGFGCWADVRNQAAVSESRVIVGHGRLATGVNPHTGDPNPHPFIYGNMVYPVPAEDPPVLCQLRGIFGKTHSFVHNGGLTVSYIENRVGVGFADLDIFWERPYGGWKIEGRFVDSEYLTMLIMKHLLIQKNCYWYGTNGVPSNDPPPGITSPEDWALCRTAGNVSIGTDASSINGVFTDGTTLWAIAKSDGELVHHVYYDDTYSGQYGFGRRIQNGSANPGGYDELPYADDGNILIMTGGADGGAQDHLLLNLNYPNELRINPVTDSEGSQQQPAISVSPSDGSFVVVWVEDFVVKGRWYNQMSLAEDNGFTVYYNSTCQGLVSPAIAHSPDGQTITMVWLEAGPQLVDDASSTLWRRSFTWDQDNHAWTPGELHAVVIQNPCGVTAPLAHPSVAYSLGGDYAIVWEKVLCPTANGEIHAIVMRGENIYMPEQILAQGAQDHEPDVAFGFRDNSAVDYFAIGYQGYEGTDSYSKVVALRDDPDGPFYTPTNLSQYGQRVAVANLSTSEFFAAYNTSADGHNGNVQVVRCQGDNQGNITVVESTDNGVAVDADSRVDIAVRGGDNDCYVTYDRINGGNGRDIYCARGHGTQLFVEPEGSPAPVNRFPANDQSRPALAIAQNYPTHENFYQDNADPDYYPFEKRRMIVWQTAGQDGGGAGLGVAGQFRGIKRSTNQLFPWETLALDPFEDPFVGLACLIEESVTISDPVVYMGCSVTIAAGATLTFEPGVTVKVAPGCQLIVDGSLVADGTTFIQLEPNNPFPRWDGILVQGSAALSNCVIAGATVGVQASKPELLTLDGCTIQNNEIGIYAYSPSGYAKPDISNCIITDNEAEGISLFCTFKASIFDCPEISRNGKDGILLNDSYAEISHNHFTANAGYGVDCYGSSPTLYCNTLEENLSGEMYLDNGSYAVMWNTSGQTGGSNSLISTDHTLITMVESYPVVVGGLNRFAIYGTQGYFMKDLSVRVPVHNVTGSTWSPNPPPAAAFWPSDLNLWKYEPRATATGCGSPKGASSNAAQTLFEQGYAAEMAGGFADASTAYMQTISQYADSSWALVAAARLFENQRQSDFAFTSLNTYYESLQTTYAEDTCLAELALDLGTRTLVEASVYDSALTTYEQIMANPPSALDSAYAAVDFAITALRAQFDSLHSGLDSELPIVSAQTILGLLRAAREATPAVPDAQHGNYLRPPTSCVLEQNYPNPFNVTTTLRYAIPTSERVRLTVYNIAGQQVALLVNSVQDAGYHSVQWDGTSLASGLYIYQLQAGGEIRTQKMLLLK